MQPRFVTRRRFLESAVFMIGGSLLAACQASGPPPSTGPAGAAATTAPAPAPTSAPAQAAGAVSIGAVMPLTGRYASLAEQVKNGYELAFADLNKNSKIQLQMKVLDDGSDATNTVRRGRARRPGEHEQGNEQEVAAVAATSAV